MPSKESKAPKAPESKGTDQKVMMPMWKDKQIVDQDHEHDLEQRSALYEFEHKLPRDLAEKAAHTEYKREQHMKAAATHFAGMKAAKATGDHDEAKKHHAMYTMHLQQLGHDSMGPLPKEIEHHMASVKGGPFYRFQPHKADAFLFNEGDKKPKSEK